MTSVRIVAGVLLMLGGFGLSKSALPEWLVWTGVLLIIVGAALVLNPRHVFQREVGRT